MQNSFPEKEEANHKKSSSFVEIMKTLIIAFILVIPVRVFIAQPFIVNGSSMDPTFSHGDYLIVDQLSYRLGSPERLDVVIFRYPKDPSKFFIKRIIGLPGENVEIQEGEVTITPVDGEPFTIDDSYILYPKTDQYETDLSEEEYFVLGDNRAESSDSRIWGPLDKEFLIGKAFVRLFPVTSFEYKPGVTPLNK